MFGRLHCQVKKKRQIEFHQVPADIFQFIFNLWWHKNRIWGANVDCRDKVKQGWRWNSGKWGEECPHVGKQNSTGGHKGMHWGVWEKMNRYDRLNRDLSALCSSAVIFSDDRLLSALWCHSFPGWQGAATIPFYFSSPQQRARLHRNTRHEPTGRRKNSWNRNIADRDYMLHYKNDNNRVEAAAEFRWPLLKLC